MWGGYAPTNYRDKAHIQVYLSVIILIPNVMHVLAACPTENKNSRNRIAKSVQISEQKLKRDPQHRYGAT